MGQVHTVEVEATVKVKVKFNNVTEATDIRALKDGARIAAEKIIAAALQKSNGYRSVQDIEPSIKEVLDTSAATVNIGKITVDL